MGWLVVRGKLHQSVRRDVLEQRDGMLPFKVEGRAREGGPDLEGSWLGSDKIGTGGAGKGKQSVQCSAAGLCAERMGRRRLGWHCWGGWR